MSAPPPSHNLAAAASMVAAMAVIGCIDNFVAPMAKEIGLWQFKLLRAAIAVPLVLCVGVMWGVALKPRRLWAVALRSALIALAMLFYFGALAFVPIAQALAGLFTAPIFILLITSLVLKQPVGPWRVLAVALGFSGIILIIAPWQDGLTLAAVLPVVGGLLYGLGSLATRTICAGETVLSMVLALFLAQGLFGALGVAILGSAEGDFIMRGWVWPLAPLTWAIVAAQAIGSVIGVGLLVRAYAIGEPTYVAPFEYSVFLFGAAFAYVFFGQTLSGLAALGVACIIAAGVIIALRASPRVQANRAASP